MAPSKVQRPTLARVAREAGVSVPTASKVVNQRDGVSPRTRRRVTAAVQRLGYVPRHRNSARTALVELVADRVGSTWTGAVLHAAERAAQHAGIGLLLSSPCAASPQTGEPAWLWRYQSRRTDGVLFCLNDSAPAVHTWLENSGGIPLVVIDPVLPVPPGTVTVSADNRQGGESAASHLVSLGHRRMAVIGGRSHSVNSRTRAEGFRAVLADAGLPAPTVCLADFDETTARLRTAELMLRHDAPTALFACSDQMARGACTELGALGLRVPEDVSVVGFDGLSGAGWPGARLTTVRQPVHEIAATALHLLLGLLDGEAPETARTEVPTYLAEGDTSAPPPA